MVKSPSQCQRCEIYVITFINFVFPATALLLTVVSRTKSAHFDMENVVQQPEKVQMYSHGKFYLQTWVCEMMNAVPREASVEGHAVLAKQCNIEKTGTVFLILFALASPSVSFWTIMNCRAPPLKDKQQVDDTKPKEDWQSDRTLVV
jgi:hypothetical protein